METSNKSWKDKIDKWLGLGGDKRQDDAIQILYKEKYGEVLKDLIGTIALAKEYQVDVFEMLDRIDGVQRVTISQKIWDYSLKTVEGYLDDLQKIREHAQACVKALKKGKQYASEKNWEIFKDEEAVKILKKFAEKSIYARELISKLQHEEDSREPYSEDFMRYFEQKAKTLDQIKADEQKKMRQNLGAQIVSEENFSAVLSESQKTIAKAWGLQVAMSEMYDKINNVKRLSICETAWENALGTYQDYLDMSSELLKYCEQRFDVLSKGKDYASEKALETFKWENIKTQINKLRLGQSEGNVLIGKLKNEEVGRERYFSKEFDKYFEEKKQKLNSQNNSQQEGEGKPQKKVSLERK